MNPSSAGNETEHLLELVSQGDERALERLLAEHRPYLRRLIELRMEDGLQARVDPSDVVQETQIVVIRRIDEFLSRRPTSFRLWLRLKPWRNSSTCGVITMPKSVPLSGKYRSHMSRRLPSPGVCAHRSPARPCNNRSWHRPPNRLWRR